jgi:hypothetical protein
VSLARIGTVTVVLHLQFGTQHCVAGRNFKIRAVMTVVVHAPSNVTDMCWPVKCDVRTVGAHNGSCNKSCQIRTTVLSTDKTCLYREFSHTFTLHFPRFWGPKVDSRTVGVSMNCSPYFPHLLFDLGETLYARSAHSVAEYL